MEKYRIEFLDENAELEAGKAVLDISIVSSPSHNLKGFCFSKDFLEFKKVSENKYCAVLLRADYPIYRQKNPYMPNGGYIEFPKEFIKKIQEHNYATKSFSFEHDNGSTIQAELVENWIVKDSVKDKTSLYGMDVSVGSWAGVLKFNTDKDFEKAIELNGGISLEFNPELVKFSKVNETAETKEKENFSQKYEEQKNVNQSKLNKKMSKVVRLGYEHEKKPSQTLKFREDSLLRKKLLSNGAFLSKIDEIAENSINRIKFNADADVILENAGNMAKDFVENMAVEVVDETIKVVDEVIKEALSPLEQALAENETLKAELETLRAELEALKSSQASSGQSMQFSSQDAEELKRKNDFLEQEVAKNKTLALNFAEQATNKEMAIHGKTELDL